MEYFGMASRTEFVLEPEQIHRKFPHPLLQRLGGLGERKTNGDPMVMGKRKGKVALVLQPPVQLQVARLHIGVSIRASRILHAPLAAVIDAQQVFRRVKCGIITLDIVVHQGYAGEQVILCHDSLSGIAVKLKDPAISSLYQRNRGAIACHYLLQHENFSFYNRRTRSQAFCINSWSWVTTKTIRPCWARLRITSDTSTIRA